MLKKLAIAAILASVGCASLSSSTVAVRGDDWSFRVPADDWSFQGVRPGTDCIEGSSLHSIGSRPMTVFAIRNCGDIAFEAVENSKNLGHGTKWFGGRLGTLEATMLEHTHPDGTSSIFYVAKVPQNECTWTFSCEGDASRASEVGDICNTMVSSLEFHR